MRIAGLERKISVLFRDGMRLSLLQVTSYPFIMTDMAWKVSIDKKILQSERFGVQRVTRVFSLAK